MRIYRDDEIAKLKAFGIVVNPVTEDHWGEIKDGFRLLPDDERADLQQRSDASKIAAASQRKIIKLVAKEADSREASNDNHDEPSDSACQLAVDQAPGHSLNVGCLSFGDSSGDMQRLSVDLTRNAKKMLHNAHNDLSDEVLCGVCSPVGLADIDEAIRHYRQKHISMMTLQKRFGAGCQHICKSKPWPVNCDPWEQDNLDVNATFPTKVNNSSSCGVFCRNTSGFLECAWKLSL